jgi:hypothetical protein
MPDSPSRVAPPDHLTIQPSVLYFGTIEEIPLFPGVIARSKLWEAVSVTDSSQWPVIG